MHIVLITDNLSQQGGAERYFYELAARLRDIPEIKVSCLGFGAKVPNAIAFPALQNPLAKLFYRFMIHPALFLRLRRHLRNLAPDVVHLHNCKQYTATVLNALRGYNVIQTTHDFSYLCPTSQNIHRDGKACKTGFSWHCFWQHRVKFSRGVFLLMALNWWLTQRRAKNLLKKCLAPSPFLTHYLQQCGFPAPEYLPPFKLETAPTHTASGHYFLFAGQLAEHKGIWLLFNAFCAALKERPTLRLVIAGKGPAEKALRKRILALQLTANIELIGWQTDLSSYYQAAQAVVFPSTGLESFGLVLTESMRHAKPIIAANQGTAAWLVKHEETGLLFDPSNQATLTDALMRLADHPDLAQKWGEAGLKRFQQLPNNADILKRLLTIYHEVSAGKSALQSEWGQTALSEQLETH